MKPTHLGLFLLLVLSVLAKDPQLIMVNELFRHGARYPVYPKKDDGSAEYTFGEHSFGELTTNGKKMHYVLGQQLYKQYWSKLFDDNTYNQSRFYVKSTDVNRTIESVQSQLMGILQNVEPLKILSEEQANFSKPQWVPDYSQDLIPVTPGPVFPEAVKYHPMVIHVEKLGTNTYDSGDFLRTYSPDNCPSQKKWIEMNQGNSKWDYITTNENFTRAIQNLSAVLGKNLTFWEAPAYYDNYECATYLMKGDKYRLSTFRNATLERPLCKHLIYSDYVYTIQMYITLYSNEKQIRATATGFFNETIRNIKKRIANKDEVRWNIYSAHDTTVGNMLAALNLTNPDCIYQGFLSKNDSNTDTCVTQYPKYTSNLIFEVWEYNSSYHSFKIRYNGQVRKIPFCNWATQCPVEVLYAWYDQFKDESFLETCGVFNREVETYFSIAAAEFMIILVLALAGLVSCLKKNLNQQKQTPAKKIESPSSTMKDSLLSEQPQGSLKEN